METEPGFCQLCNCPFTELHEGQAAYCDECEAGPFCRSCLVIRHNPCRDHSLIRKILKAFGIVRCRCLMCLEVSR